MPKALKPRQPDALRLTCTGHATTPRRMTQKTALITGASRGLGAALAERLAPTHHIIAVARTTGALEDLDDRIQARGGSATLAPMDITEQAAMATLCRGIHDRWGSLDLWMHCAIHATLLGPAQFTNLKDWDRAMAVNATATAVLINYVTPLLGQSGQAVFFDDPLAGDRFFGTYGATKAAQIALARSWANETTKIGPRVQVLSPDPMPTATRARFFPGEDRDTLSPAMTQAQNILDHLNLE